MNRKDRLIEKILDIEVYMFLTVTSKRKSNCQNYPDRFKMQRKAQFIPWSTSTLESYLDDLVTAEKESRNLMVFKYARMDGLIPVGNNNPLIKKIAGAFKEWQEALDSLIHLCNLNCTLIR